MQALAVTINPLVEQPHPSLNIWQSLYYELQAAGHSKVQIANWASITTRSVDRLLAGTTKQPSYKSFSRILHAYYSHTLTHKGPMPRGGE